MTRWRYQTVMALPVFDGSLFYVTSIDGDTEVPIIEKRGLKTERILLHDYLQGAGEEGWEVCGTNILGQSNRMIILLKKPA